MLDPNQHYMDLSRFKVDKTFRGRSPFFVQLWWIVETLFIHGSPQVLYGWRRFWLRLFGAKIGKNVIIRPSVRITYPWKVSIGDHSWIGDRVELYSLGPIDIGTNVVVSQDTYICAGTHDHTKVGFPLVARPVVVEDEAWIASGCFVAPGVSIGRGAIVGARSVVLNDMPTGMLCGGHPAKPLKERLIPKDS